MKSNITIGSRLALGLVLFVVGGLNGFFQFLPMPQPPQEAVAFWGTLYQTGYFLPFLSTVQLIVGASLLTNMYVPLMLTIIAPVILNIVAYHLFLDSEGVPVAMILLALEIYLAYSYRDSYKAILVRKSEPATSA